jgi:hypothetical protein
LTPLDAFNFGLDKIIKASDQAVRNCEEKRLDPPSSYTIKCLYCEGRGYFKAQHCAATTCNFLRYCPCECQACAYVECDICAGAGEIEEPEEWRDDGWWEAKWDERHDK